MASSVLKKFSFRPLQQLHLSLSQAVALDASLMGLTLDGHQAEGNIQSAIIKVLVPHMPAPTILRQNKMLLEDPILGRCIPDVLVDRVDGQLWCVFELKTLLFNDQLTEADVERDLQKLCAYKAANPSAAAVFMLVGSKEKLLDGRGVWSRAGLKVDETIFEDTKMPPQPISNLAYRAIPCGWSGRHKEVLTCSWEIQPVSAGSQVQSSTYTFFARMAVSSPVK